MKTKLTALIATSILLLSGAQAAHATENTLHPDVAYAVNAVPGGDIIDEFTVAWPELGMELHVQNSNLRAVGSCATGQYCAYSGLNGNGTRLSFSTCTTVSTSALPLVSSVANARTSGTVQARNSAGTTLATAAAGARVNVTGTVATLRCTP